jgi:hypothetical protein
MIRLAIVALLTAYVIGPGTASITSLVCAAAPAAENADQAAIPGRSANGAESGADENTLALWLFDETPYPNCILTDASGHEHDLRLISPYEKWWDQTEGESGAPEAPPLHVAGKHGLVKGKYGNALYTPADGPAEVIWPSRSQRYAEHVYMTDVGYGVPEPLNLGYFDYTIECWYNSIGPQTEKGVIFRVTNEKHRRTPTWSMRCTWMYRRVSFSCGVKRFPKSSSSLRSLFPPIFVAFKTASGTIWRSPTRRMNSKCGTTSTVCSNRCLTRADFCRP